MAKLTVALVDDDNDIRDVIRAILEGAGYDVEVFQSAWDFLKLCEESGLRHDVVLMDVIMFGMSGIEAAATLRARLASRGTRLIFMSTQLKALTAAEAAFGESATYVSKPMEPDVLIDVVAPRAVNPRTG